MADFLLVRQRGTTLLSNKRAKKSQIEIYNLPSPFAKKRKEKEKMCHDLH